MVTIIGAWSKIIARTMCDYLLLLSKIPLDKIFRLDSLLYCMFKIRMNLLRYSLHHNCIIFTVVHARNFMINYMPEINSTVATPIPSFRGGIWEQDNIIMKHILKCKPSAHRSK